MRKKLAQTLRLWAYKLDGQETINRRWHRISVESMNRYIEDQEALLSRVVDYFDGNLLDCELFSILADLPKSQLRSLPEGPTRDRLLELSKADMRVGSHCGGPQEPDSP